MKNGDKILKHLQEKNLFMLIVGSIISNVSSSTLTDKKSWFINSTSLSSEDDLLLLV